MTLKEQLDQDVKAAMLGGDKQLAQTLRGLKSAILYAEVAKGNREQGLSDQEVIEVLTKEAKKRIESAEMYLKGGDEARHQAEMVEKAVIEKYLPQQLTDEELGKLVDEAIAESGETGPQAMGKVIGAVKAKTAGQADGSRIAAMVKERLQ